MARLKWVVIGHNPTRWALGEIEDDIIKNIIARVTRKANGSWMWMEYKYNLWGIEPSCDWAKITVMRQIKEDIITF